MTTTTSVFDFPNHTVEDKMQDPQTRVTLGNSYQFATPPSAPVPRIFTLAFETMWRGLNADGTIDTTTRAQMNAGALYNFYQTYMLHKTFQYPHPWFGMVNVRFNQPLVIPKGRIGGDGWCEAFTIELMEQP